MAAQADQPRRAVRAGALFGVLVLARLLGGATAPAPGAGPWILPATLAHDLLITLAFFAADRVLRRPAWLWLVYWGIALLAAINVPIVRALGLSLTVPMLRAARAPLFDSIGVYVTPSNILAVALVLAAAAVLPHLLRPVDVRARRVALLGGLALLAIAPAALARVPTAGRERNVVTALASAWSSRIAPPTAPAGTDWRASPFEQASPDSAVDYRAAARGFNVLLIVLESTAAQYLAPYGAADDPMPTVTDLASRSLVVDGTYTPYPESIRALFSIGCAEPPAFDVPAEQLVASACDSLPRRFNESGYRTALFHSGRFTYLGMAEVLAALRFDTAVDAGGIGGRVESSFGVDEPSAVAKMLEWIDQGEASRPFFLTYIPAAGHHPYASSGNGPFAPTSNLAAYKNSIHEGDRSIATLLAGLQARNLDAETVVVVTSDHGEAFGQHAGNSAHSFFIYDENIRVPLVFHVPGQRAGRLARVSSLVDVGPTILDMVGAPRPPGVEGVSLLDGPERLALFFTDYAVGWLGLRDGCLKYLLAVEAKRSHLYDVCRDPDERTNLAPASPERVAAYRNRVEEWAAHRRAAVLAAGASGR